MSAISLLHAIGVLLILLPSIHLADHRKMTTTSTTTTMRTSTRTRTTTMSTNLNNVSVLRDIRGKEEGSNQNQTLNSIKMLFGSTTTATTTMTGRMSDTRMTVTGTAIPIPTTTTTMSMSMFQHQQIQFNIRQHPTTTTPTPTPTPIPPILIPTHIPPRSSSRPPSSSLLFFVKWTKDNDNDNNNYHSTLQLDEFGRERRSSSKDLIGLLSEDPSEPLQLSSSSTRVIGPYFESNQTSMTISARAGQDVMLDCAVVLLQGRTVSWLRRRSENLQLLTVGNQTYSSDSRLGLHFRYPNNWRLGILKVNKRDEGEYQCQLSTHPPKALIFHLKVIAPAVQILDDNEHVITERHYKVDSSLHLTCRASHLDKLVDHVTWFKGDRLLPGTDTRVKVKQWKNQTNGEASAFLSVLSVRKGDSGNYSCRASSLAQNTIVVHVLNEKLPAAVQHGNSANVLSVCHREEDFVFCFLNAKGLLPSFLMSLLISHLQHHFICIL